MQMCFVCEEDEEEMGGQYIGTATSLNKLTN